MKPVAMQATGFWVNLVAGTGLLKSNGHGDEPTDLGEFAVLDPGRC